MKNMSIKDFTELGYLQEVNRQVLHPLGLALEVTVEDNGTYALSGVQDHRDDPEGMYFVELDKGKHSYIQEQIASRKESRMNALGYWVQMTENL